MSGRAPDIPVARPFFGEEEASAVADVLRSGWVTQGPRVAAFEEAFARWVGASEAVAVTSCTTAMHLTFEALGIGRGDEVICPSYSFIATANAIIHAGADPVFADIDPLTYNLDPSSVERALGPRTRAILAVHQVGLPAPMEALGGLARDHDLLLIEDAACAIGSEHAGRRIGSPFGQAACFSFHPRKILTTGDGGMITTSDAGLADRLRRQRHHGMSLSDTERHRSVRVVFESYVDVGYNYRMTDLQAAVGLVQLGRLPEFLAVRRARARRYDEAFGDHAALVPPHEPPASRHNYQSYLLRLGPDARVGRDALLQRLLDRGIAARRGVMCAHLEPAYSDHPIRVPLDRSEEALAHTLVLPLFHDMTDDDQDRVIDEVVASA